MGFQLPNSRTDVKLEAKRSGCCQKKKVNAPAIGKAVSPKKPENLGEAMWAKLENGIMGIVPCDKKGDAQTALMNAKNGFKGIGDAVGGAINGVQRGFDGIVNACKGAFTPPAAAGARR